MTPNLKTVKDKSCITGLLKIKAKLNEQKGWGFEYVATVWWTHGGND